MRRVFLSTVQSADIVITCHPTVQRNYHKQTFLMMLIYLPTIVHNQSLLWWNVNRIQKVMQSCKKKGWWIEGSLRFFWHNAKASKLLSTNALITKWNFYGWEKQLGKMWKECDQASPQNLLLLYTQCLKITRLSHLNFSIMAFFTNFWLIKSKSNTVWPQTSVFFSKIPQN